MDAKGYSRLAIRLGRWMIVIGVALLLASATFFWVVIATSHY